MTSSSDSGDKAQRIERIRTMVNDDFDRISGCDDPWIILNLPKLATWEEVAAKYERYERFYRAENFQKLGDMDLTRKALDIRRAVGRAIVEIESHLETASSEVHDEPASILDIDVDAFALGDIYFRDGLTYLRLGDLDESIQCFQKACDYDPTRGIARGYLTYTQFRRNMYDPRVVDEARKAMSQASRLSPKDPDVFVLIARFHIKLGELDESELAVKRVEALDPKHPKLSKLRQRLERANEAQPERSSH